MSSLEQQIDATFAAAPRSDAAPDWLRALAQRDQARFLDHGLPHRRLEAWKYTPLDVRDAPGGTAEASADPVIGEGHVVDLVDGAPGALPANLPEGVSLEPLDLALASGTSALRLALEGLETDAPDRALAALNTAFLGGDPGAGLVLRIADGVDAGLLNLRWRGSAASPALANTRILVLLGDDARLDLVEDYATGRALNVVHQFILGARSRLRHARLQDNVADSWLITRTEVAQGTDSVFEQSSLDLGAGLARHDLQARLAAPGAGCITRGAYLPAGEAHVDHHLDVRHESTGCRSEQTFRGVLQGRGRAVFNGRVHVLPGADDSEAHQSNQNLLLSRDAEVDTKPELVIEADEVVASHGATVGQLDEDAVFYLRSRGLGEDTARRVLTGAFCRAVIGAIGLEAARTAFLERLDAHLETEA